ncbi:MAG: hypothetical protein FXF47_09920 [Candidatus Mcinerneyibacterium aminivorans]|uniref:SGNH/GDSL hydrolase family protein n=1 Tax=Candidatus Mcinerneyibacterium aminivorans TaxID=2703815 RepID=A0A5D0MI86_9BACT|nr:MAG: hypothetical protein FXF47_09920 [Candidatus Mcinerneyibacterium aminivorans]
MKKLFYSILILNLIFFACSSDSSTSFNDSNQNPDTEGLIVDHTSTNINAISQNLIEEAKSNLHIAYGHTSHGSQITDGMSPLDSFMGGTGLYTFSSDGINNTLHLYEGDGYGDGDMDHDCGYYPNWVNETREFLGDPDPNTGRGTNHPEFNVIMWSWCGQISSKTEETMRTEYLEPMSELENDYPVVIFVYMTGHLDGTGESGNLHQRNEQIRQYCIDNNKVLYDFADIESYDPDGNYYLDKLANDNCDYDSDNNGTRDTNWAIQWQNSHTEGINWYSCSCAHSQSLNGNLKAYAAWYLFAHISQL